MKPQLNTLDTPTDIHARVTQPQRPSRGALSMLTVSVVLVRDECLLLFSPVCDRHLEHPLRGIRLSAGQQWTPQVLCGEVGEDRSFCLLLFHHWPQQRRSCWSACGHTRADVSAPRAAATPGRDATMRRLRNYVHCVRPLRPGPMLAVCEQKQNIKKIMQYISKSCHYS